MKRLFIFLLIFVGPLISLMAVDMSSVTITKTTNTLVSDRSQLASLLPSGYQNNIFDASDNPTMHKLYFLMTMPAGMSDYTIGSVTLQAQHDYLFSYKADATNKRYVMDSEPMDPTLRSLYSINVNDLRDMLNPGGSNVKIYITGSLSSGNKLKVELPETVKLLEAPNYIKDYEQDIIDAIVSEIHSQIDANTTLTDFTFNQPTEGFFFFEGDDDTQLDLYLEDLNMVTADKQIDFLGMMLLNKMNFNLAGLSSTTSASSTRDELISATLNLLNDKLSIQGMLGDQSLGFDFVATMFNSLVQGTSSPFAFYSTTDNTSTPFRINIHTKGTVTLTGGAKGEFKNTANEMKYIAEEGLKMDPSAPLVSELQELATIFQQMVNFTSAPIAVRPKSKTEEDDFKYSVTRLTFDDVWKINGTNTHTNGQLCLPVVGSDLDAPSIDIGTPYGQVIFNSGRYKFHTPVSNKVKNMFFVASMSICYRELFVTMPLMGKITYAGIGTSVGTGPTGDKEDRYINVTINDGTFETYSAEDWTTGRGDNNVDGVANGWYKNYTDWRLPYQTRIYGGSFNNCDVYRCDASAEVGSSPIYIYQHELVFDTTNLCQRTPVDARLLCTGETLSRNPNLTVNTAAATKSFTVNGSPTDGTWNYNIASLTTDNNDKVWLYAPAGCSLNDNKYIHNYTTAIVPLGERHIGTNMMEMGGDVEVKARFQNLYDQTNAYLLYTQLGYYTRKYGGVEFVGGIKRTIEQEMQIEPEKHRNYTNQNDKTGLVFSEVSNKSEYRIEHGIYMMIPIMSDKWFMFAPPFDVANVYVLETTRDRGIASWTEERWEKYYQDQGVADGNMAQVLVTSVLPDIFSGKGSGVLKPLPYILNNLTNDETKTRKLTHYDGTNFSTANFYLNKMVKDTLTRSWWTLQNNQIYYGNKWQTAPATAEPQFITEKVCVENCDKSPRYQVFEDQIIRYTDQDGNPQSQQYCIMQRDSIYSLYFPGGSMRYYDYKYLILEGYGPQYVSGEQIHSSFASSDPEETGRFPDDGYVAIQGNFSLANDTIEVASTQPLFFPKETSSLVYEFVPDNAASQTILPGKVYMVSHTQTAVSQMPAVNDGNSGNKDINNLPLPLLTDQPSLEAWTNKGIYLHAHSNQTIYILSTDGRILWNGEIPAETTQFIPADTGMYIIQGETAVIKVINY